MRRPGGTRSVRRLVAAVLRAALVHAAFVHAADPAATRPQATNGRVSGEVELTWIHWTLLSALFAGWPRSWSG